MAHWLEDREALNDRIVASRYHIGELYSEDERGSFYFPTHEDLALNRPVWLNHPPARLLHQQNRELVAYLSDIGKAHEGATITDSSGERWVFIEESWIHESVVAERNELADRQAVQLELM